MAYKSLSFRRGFFLYSDRINEITPKKKGYFVMTDTEFITRQEHDEFSRRMESENQRIDDENHRQNKRLEALEETVKEINKLSISIEKMTSSIQTMTGEITKQGQRIEGLESKPAKRWEALIGALIGAVAAAIGAAFMAGIIH